MASRGRWINLDRMTAQIDADKEAEAKLLIAEDSGGEPPTKTEGGDYYVAAPPRDSPIDQLVAITP